MILIHLCKRLYLDGTLYSKFHFNLQTIVYTEHPLPNTRQDTFIQKHSVYTHINLGYDGNKTFMK